MIGAKLLHYEITEKLGEGGMGVVYKARDTHLDRFVAIKVLPAERMADASRKARFVQEAKAASALNHPNIIVVHDISSDAGHDFIAMEFVAGKTLDQLIPRKGMRLNDALKIAVQIADALSRAHSAGIIHRDLKPANIMVDSHGQVKVLDFGLAKLTEQGTSEDDSTATIGVKTDEGSIVGTAAYMSPEQAEGKPLDARSDIFSFGAVLYEMITGQRAFRGDSKMSTLSAVLHKEPAPLPVELPNDLQKLVGRCLRKDPNRRFHHFVDLKVALDDLREESESGEAVAMHSPARRRPKWLWMAAAAVLALAAVLVSRALISSRNKPAGKLEVVPITSFPGREMHPSFSPDGNQVAFTWNGGQRGPTHQGPIRPDIYVMLVGAGTPLRLTNSPAPDQYPAWSPDGRQIAFLRSEGSQTFIYLISPLGGPEQRLAECRAVPDTPIAWSADGGWLIVGELLPDGQNGLFAIPIKGGGKKRLTSNPGGFDHQPALSPDGRLLAFASGRNLHACDVHVLALGPGLVPAAPPRRLTKQSMFFRGLAWAPDGRSVVYSASRVANVNPYLWRVDAAGDTPPERLEYAGPWSYGPAASPAARRLAFVRGKSDPDIVRIREGSSAERFLSSTLLDNNPQFSPDAKRIAFASSRAGAASEIWVADADGSNALQITRDVGRYQGTPRWSPDGRWIAFDSQGEDGTYDIFVVDAAGGEPRRLTTSSSSEIVPSWSHDGTWIYFSSDRSGQLEIWRMPAGGGQAVRLTERGGFVAFESCDGKTLYYLKEGSLSRGGPLFARPLAGGPERIVIDLVLARSFVVFPDGIYYVGQREPDGGYPIRFHELTTGRERTVAKFNDIPSYALTVSPDRKTFLAAVLPRADDDIMLVENFR